jgi:hypothetical protein
MKFEDKIVLKKFINEIISEYEDISEMAKGAIKAFSRKGADGKSMLQKYAENPEDITFKKQQVYHLQNGKIVDDSGFHISPDDATESKSMKIGDAIALALVQNKDVKQRYDEYSGNSGSKEFVDGEEENSNLFSDVEYRKIKNALGKTLVNPGLPDENSDMWGIVRVNISNFEEDGYVLITKKDGIYDLEFVDTKNDLDKDEAVSIDDVISKIKVLKSDSGMMSGGMLEEGYKRLSKIAFHKKGML